MKKMYALEIKLEFDVDEKRTIKYYALGENEKEVRKSAGEFFVDLLGPGCKVVIVDVNKIVDLT